MPRKVKDRLLDTREARSKLKPRGKPYYRMIDPGLHLGYRRLNLAGKWVVRNYAGEETYTVETFATSDDLSDANGVDVLNFSQAQAKARQIRDGHSHAAAGTAPYTVNDAVAAYVQYLEDKKKTAADADYRYRAFIKDELGGIQLAALKADKIRAWHSNLAKTGKRLRTAKGDKQKHAPLGKDEEVRRRRKVSANRNLIILRAALNMAWRNDKVTSNVEWRKVRPFENVNVARVRYLEVSEAKRLLNACEPNFRNLVQAALQTGARYGELVRLKVSDFNRLSGTIAVPTSKSGKPRHIVLTDEGRAFFQHICAGRSGSESMLKRADGLQWAASHQRRPMIDAVKRAKISPPISFHSLRHTWASLAVMNGVPLMVVAKNLGHRDTSMVEQHYGHLAPSFIADPIRAGAPKFGFVPDKKIAELKRLTESKPIIS